MYSWISVCSWLLIRTHWFPVEAESHFIRLVFPTEVSPWMSTGCMLITETTHKKRGKKTCKICKGEIARV